MRKRTGFTLIEILVVVAIIGLLVSILMPSLSAVRRAGRKTVCQHNLHAISIAMETYLPRNKDIFPKVNNLPSQTDIDDPKHPDYLGPPLPLLLRRDMAIKGNTGESEVYRCPADKNLELPTLGGSTYYETEGVSYEYNTIELEGVRLGFRGRLWTLNNLLPRRADEVWMIWDFEEFHGRKLPRSRNVLYADLHVGSQ